MRMPKYIAITWWTLKLPILLQASPPSSFVFYRLIWHLIHFKRVWKCTKALSYKVSSSQETKAIDPPTFWGRIISHWDHGYERVVEYMLKVPISPSHWLPRIAWEASKKIQKTHRSKMLCSSWMQDMEKCFGSWHATHLLHDASLDSFLNEAFLQYQCIMRWDKCGGSRFTQYTTPIAPNYKTMFFAEWGNHTHRYMLEPIPLSTIQTMASMCLISRIAMWDMSLGHMWSNPCTNLSHNHNVHSQLQHSSVKFLNIESRYSLSHVMHPHKSNIYMYISKKSNHYKLFYFGSILYIWTSRFLIKSIYVIHIFVLEPTGLTKISTC